MITTSLTVDGHGPRFGIEGIKISLHVGYLDLGKILRLYDKTEDLRERERLEREMGQIGYKILNLDDQLNSQGGTA